MCSVKGLNYWRYGLRDKGVNFKVGVKDSLFSFHVLSSLLHRVGLIAVLSLWLGCPKQVPRGCLLWEGPWSAAEPGRSNETLPAVSCCREQERSGETSSVTRGDGRYRGQQGTRVCWLNGEVTHKSGASTARGRVAEDHGKKESSAEGKGAISVHSSSYQLFPSWAEVKHAGTSNLGHALPRRVGLGDPWVPKLIFYVSVEKPFPKNNVSLISRFNLLSDVQTKHPFPSGMRASSSSPSFWTIEPVHIGHHTTQPGQSALTLPHSWSADGLHMLMLSGAGWSRALGNRARPLELQCLEPHHCCY